jgi:hypothetical protein
VVTPNLTAERLSRHRGLQEPNLRAHQGLVLLCITGAVVEAVFVGWLGPRPALALAPQATAPAPWAVFHDLRWLLVYTHSWLTVGLESLAFVVVRGGLTAVTVWLAWPQDRDRPSFVTLARRAVTFTIAAAVLLTFSASLLVGLAVISVSYLFFASVPVALLLALLLHHGPVVDWWRAGPTLRTVGWAALTFVMLSLGGAAIAVSPWPLSIVVAAAAGLFNAWAWLGITRALALRESRRFVPLAPIGIAALAAVVIIGVVVAVQLQTARHGIADATASSTADNGTGQPVLVVTGYDSHWRGGDSLDFGPGLVQRRFSYAGMTPTGRPAVFTGRDTDKPLPELVHLMQQQVQAFAQETGRRIDIVSDSQGALVAKVFLLVHPDAPVRVHVLTSPLVEPGRAYFPVAGSNGYGIVAGYELRGVSAALRALTPLDFSPDGPFLRSVADNAPLLQSWLLCPLPNTTELTLFPLADAVGAPYDATRHVRAAVLPAFHGKLLQDGSSQRAIGEYLRTGKMHGYRGLRLTERIVRAAAAAWQAPSLRMNLNHVWGPDADHNRDCATTTAHLREWIG